MLDTYVFFSVAFLGTTDPFMAEHWFDLATVDYFVKITSNLAIFVPIYGMALSYLSKYVFKRPLTC